MNRRPLLITGVAIVVAMVAVGAWAWFQLPPDAQVPTHFGPSGQADAYSGKTVGLLLGPAIAAGVLALLLAIPSIEPRRANLARSGVAYTAIGITTMGLLGAVQLLTVAAALGAELNVTFIVMAGVGVLFIVIGAVLPRLRSTFMVGIRTPWTLTSERSWVRTHQVGGVLFIAGGLLLIAGAVVLPPAALPTVMLSLVAVIVVVPTVVSYLVWRSDPDRKQD